ncbi:MAG: FAD-dependent monooxygenase [Alteraurantiacibacter sp. bin_em_oilr2.035]|nr:FAD-dependent monooxygenase [Alteraurantiacibacter sp. bin_em_oilr2.035]
MDSPLIIGAGPAGNAAAIRLAQVGITSTLIDRDEDVGDPLCGGFLSWRTAEQLRALGVDIHAAGAQFVSRLRLFAGAREASMDLPQTGYGLSRHALDSAMRKVALQHGARIECDTIRAISEGTAQGHAMDWKAETIFLAVGKHDMRGLSRPRRARDKTLGLRLRLPRSALRDQLLGGAIELHLFKGGYAGIVQQENGSTNICLALRKSALARSGGSPVDLFEQLTHESPALAERLGDDWQDARFDTIGAVPYGWICSNTEDRLYRLGDQAAVIPSLAGEGISIALASGIMAAKYHWEGKDAGAFQKNFANLARRPVRLASAAWHAAESRIGARAAIALAHIAPRLIASFAELARIPVQPSLAPR